MHASPPSSTTLSPPLYRTSSLFESAFLRTKGFTVVGKEQAGSKVSLLFHASSALDQAVQDFYNGSEAQRLFQEFVSLKDFSFERR